MEKNTFRISETKAHALWLEPKLFVPKNDLLSLAPKSTVFSGRCSLWEHPRLTGDLEVEAVRCPLCVRELHGNGQGVELPIRISDSDLISDSGVWGEA